MTTHGAHHDSDELAPGPDTTYDLIICHNDRIVFHDHYASPAFRLRMCVQLLTCSDVVGRTIDAARASKIEDLYRSRSTQWDTAPDAVVNAIAKYCRSWGVHIFVSTTKKTSTAPAVLYSVITEYGPGQIVVEHFPTTQARHGSLIERVRQFFRAPDDIPELVLADDQRLAALVATFLMPATVTLAEAALDNATGSYAPSSGALPVH